MKILLIEDDPEALKLEQRVLLDAGYAVDTASDAQDALTKLKTVPYRGVVLDVAVSGVDAERIGTLDTNSRTPVIIIGSGDADNRKRAFDAGAAAFLNKPFTAEAFRSVILSAISPAGPGPIGVPRVAPRRPAATASPPPSQAWPPPARTSPAPSQTWPDPPRATPRPLQASPAPSRALQATEPIAVRSQEGIVYWCEPDPDGGWRCGRCETGVIASAGTGSPCSICHAEVVALQERSRGGLGWLIILVLLGLLGWAAFQWWAHWAGP